MLSYLIIVIERLQNLELLCVRWLHSLLDHFLHRKQARVETLQESFFEGKFRFEFSQELTMLADVQLDHFIIAIYEVVPDAFFFFFLDLVVRFDFIFEYLLAQEPPPQVF